MHVHALRKALGADRIVTQAPGYLLRLEHEELDASHFKTLLEEGARLQARGDHEAAASTLSRGLALWRGPALADLALREVAVWTAHRGSVRATLLLSANYTDQALSASARIRAIDSSSASTSVTCPSLRPARGFFP